MGVDLDGEGVAFAGEGCAFLPRPVLCLRVLPQVDDVGEDAVPGGGVGLGEGPGVALFHEGSGAERVEVQADDVEDRAVGGADVAGPVPHGLPFPGLGVELVEVRLAGGRLLGAGGGPTDAPLGVVHGEVELDDHLLGAGVQHGGFVAGGPDLAVEGVSDRVDDRGLAGSHLAGDGGRGEGCEVDGLRFEVGLEALDGEHGGSHPPSLRCCIYVCKVLSPPVTIGARSEGQPRRCRHGGAAVRPERCHWARVTAGRMGWTTRGVTSGARGESTRCPSPNRCVTPARGRGGPKAVLGSPTR